MEEIVQTLFYIHDFVYTYYNVSFCGVLKGRFSFFQNLLNKRVNSIIWTDPFCNWLENSSELSLLEKCLLDRVQRTSFVELELRHVRMYLRCR